MERNNKHNEEESIKKMFESSKIKASEKLKYRIMHQIEAEKALTQKESQNKVLTKESTESVLKDFTSIFGIMYAVLAVIIATAYFLQGKEFMQSPQLWSSIIFVGFVFSLLWLISRLDANIKEKKQIR